MEKVFSREESDKILKEKMMFIGKIVREERQKRGWDILELIIKSGISQVALYNIEAGRTRNITLESVIGLSIAFDMDIFKLISD